MLAEALPEDGGEVGVVEGAGVLAKEGVDAVEVALGVGIALEVEGELGVAFGELGAALGFEGGVFVGLDLEGDLVEGLGDVGNGLGKVPKGDGRGGNGLGADAGQAEGGAVEAGDFCEADHERVLVRKRLKRSG